MTKDQVITEDYAIYNSDCMYVMPTIGDKSIDLSKYRSDNAEYEKLLREGREC